jgi:glycosyltransferase involved in cell wall biosynthesis
MRHVVFVLQEPTPYRTPHLERLAARPDLEVTVVYAARTVQRREWDVPAEDARTIYLSGPSLPATRLLQHDYALTPGIWPLLTRLRPDVVVVGGWSLMATQLAIVWARTHRVPYVVMSDNHLREPRPAWVRAVKRVVLRRIVPQAAAALTPGSLGRAHLEHYGAARVVVFPLTVDVAATAEAVDHLRARRDELRDSFGVAGDGLCVLTVARLIAQKNVDVLLRAASRAAVHVLVVGSGPQEADLRELAASLGVRVTFTGFLADERLLEAYAAADVFALLSARETWGVVVNEAAAAGLPLVLTDAVGAAADLLEPGENGELVPVGDALETAAALARLAADPALRARYGRRSREIVSAWGYDESVSALAALVDELAA